VRQGATVAPTITANTITDPLSGTTADVINFAANAGGDKGFVFQSTTNCPLIGNRTFTWSVYLKVPSGTASINLQLEDSTFNVIFAQTVTVTTTWTRFSVTGTFAANSQATNLACFIVYLGTPAQAVHVWGAELNRGSTPIATYSRISAAQGPRVNGGSQTGKSLNVIMSDTGAQANTLLMLKGDYIQLGTGTAQRAYKLLNDITTDGSQNATMDLFPRLRESPAANTPIYWYDARGNFRLQDNVNGWDLDEASIYGVHFRGIEAF
jgi:hypothetical protein